MRIALIVGALALAALTVGAFIFLTGEEELDFDPHGGMAEAEDGDTVRARRSGVVDREGEEASANAASVAGEDDAASDELAAHSVLVVDENHEPVAGARVEVLARGDDDPFAFFRGDRGDGDRVVFSATTGADGVAPLRLGDGDRARVRATKNRNYGSAEVDLGDLDAEAVTLGVEAVISLLPVRDLEVKVVGLGDAPAPHVLVSVSDSNRRRGPGGPGGRRNRGRRGRSLFGGRQEWSADPTGLAAFEINSDDDVYEAESIEIRPQMPGFEIEPTTVDLLPAGVTRALVKIPESIAVELELTQADATAYTDPVSVRWLVTALADVKSEELGRGWFTRSMFGTRTVEGGKATIRGFAPGSTVTFRVTLDDRMPAEVEVPLPPAAATEYVKLAIGADRPHVVARLVDPDGGGVRRQRVTAEVEMAGAQAEDANPFAAGRRGRGGADFARNMMRRMDRDPTQRTDRDGVIRIPVEPGASGKVEIFAGRRMRMPWGGDDGGALATIEFPVLEPGAEHDVGDVTLDRGPLLVAGRVVDGKGQAQPGVNVVVSTEREGGGDDPSAVMRRRMRRGPGGRRGGQDMRARTDGEGTFKIWGAPADGARYEVTARGRGVVATPVAFSPGAGDVEIVVESPGTVEGSLAFTDERFAKLGAEVSMRPQGADDGAWRRFRVGGDRKFRSRGLIAGLYELRVRLGGHDALTRSGIEVVGGEDRRPPELQDLLVGGGLQVAEVIVLDDARRPVGGARVTLQVDGETFDFRRMFGGNRTGADGSVERVLDANVTARVSVRAEGFADADVTASVFPVTVEMIRGSSLVVEFGGGVPDVAGLRGYRMSLRSANEQPVAGDDPAAMLRRRMGERGGRTVSAGATSAELGNIAPGEYRVMLQLRPDAAGRGRRSFFGAFNPPEIELGTVTLEAGGGEQTAKFTLDAGEVEAALAEWEARNTENAGGGNGR